MAHAVQSALPHMDPLAWIGFLVFVLVMLAIDLGAFHRKAHVVRLREALSWSVLWIVLAFAFAGVVWAEYGQTRALEFVAGYLIEKSLSVDNLVVFLVLFSALGVRPEQRHRVLFWGVLSALVMRAGMIFAGAALLERFHWLEYVFGGFLVVTAVKLWTERAEPAGEGRAVGLVRRVLPKAASPFLVALVAIEITDLVFAVDSLPAVFAVTTDPFIVFTSNVFAILGMRSLFFVVSGMLESLHYLKHALAVILLFVGTKMILTDYVAIPVFVSIGVILGVLAIAVVASLAFRRARIGGMSGA